MSSSGASARLIAGRGNSAGQASIAGMLVRSQTKCLRVFERMKLKSEAVVSLGSTSFPSSHCQIWNRLAGAMQFSANAWERRNGRRYIFISGHSFSGRGHLQVLLWCTQCLPLLELCCSLKGGIDCSRALLLARYVDRPCSPCENQDPCQRARHENARW